MDKDAPDLSTKDVNRSHSYWWTGAKSALPIVFGYIPIGFAFGVLAVKAGIGFLPALLMSVFVYAGSAQLIAVGLIGAGADLVSITLTTFVVNLRHLLMSAALAPYLRHLSRGEAAWFGFELTDESFAVHSSELAKEESSRSHLFALNGTAQLAWVVGTMLGALLGVSMGDTGRWGLDFALPAMFIALLILQCKSRRHILVAVAAAVISVALAAGFTARWNVIIATLIAGILGVYLEKWS
ncbi:MAG: AzlC family ABC transporter permease [Firmicutes bacterium]|nr:AzlC family ABC transporter permease [Bacillota bacterium]